MTVNASSQALELAVCILAGGVAAIVYDLMWYLRAAFKFTRTAGFAADLAFSSAAVLITLFTLLQFCFGKPLLYHFLGLCLGFYVVNRILSKYVRSITIKAGKWVARLYKKLQKSKITKRIFK